MSTKPVECAADSDSELDWSYTAQCTKEWSDDELLSHLCSKAFTIPPRDYNPSAPFVYIRAEDGVITTLPHGYRLPLMFIAKYQWEITTRTLSLQNRQRWGEVRDEVLHLSRLCQTLFLKAHAKAESSGMEKGWRCIMFDRVLTRVYKGWPVSSPAKVDAFLFHFSPKEYERDVLKYDWKRWVLKGFSRPTSSSTIHLTEEDVNDGITAVDLKMRLFKIDNIWTLSTRTKNNNIKRRPIKFIQLTDGSSSELTDFDWSLDEDEDEDEEVAEITPNPNPNPFDTPTKRGRETSQDEDSKNRSEKRAKLEEIIRSISSIPCTPIPSADGLNHGDLCPEELDPLPKFKVPREILHSCGWKQLPAATRPPQREERRMEEEELEEGIIPPCGVDNSSTLIPTSPHQTSTTTLVPPIPPDHDPSSSHPNPSTVGPDNDSDEIVFNVPSLLKKTSATSLSAPTSTSRSKSKQPPSISASITIATTTFRNPRNSAYVSLPSSSRMKPRRKLPSPAPASATPEPPLPSSVTENGRTLKVKRRFIDRKQDKAVKTDKGKGKEVCVEERKSNIQHSEPSSSSPSVINAVLNDHSTTATAIVIPDPPLNQGPDLVHTQPLEFQLLTNMLDPECLAMANDPWRISSSSPLSSLSSSVTPGPLMGDIEVGPEQTKDRIRELKTKFLGFRDELGRIIGRLEEMEAGEDGDGDVCLRDQSIFVSQTEERRKRKGKDSEMDVEMMDVSRSGAATGYVDAAVGVDASVVSRDVSVQTDEPANTITVQTVNVNSATSLPETLDDLSNVTKKNPVQIKPTLSLESKTDDGFPAQAPFINSAAASTSQLSTMVDNLVSIKMLSMMQTLVKNSIGGSSSNGKAKLVEPSSTASVNAATNSTTTTTTESDSDTLRQASPSSSSLSISAVDTYDNIMSSLLDELKTIKEEARFREQSEKEDLLAMRQLHSAEVDALRRRLSYLEWRNMSGGEGGRWRGSRVDDALDLDRRHHHSRRFVENHQTPFRQPYGDDRFQPNSHSSSIINNPEGSSGELTRTNTTTTTMTTTTTTPQSPLSLRKPNSDSTIERYHGVSRNAHQHQQHMDWDDGIVNLSLPLPLPVKSQRKQHMMAFARTHFS